MAEAVPDYLNPGIPADVDTVEMPTIRGDDQSLQGFGKIVGDDYENHDIEIVRWPAQGWRPVDPDCGDEGGTTQGVFVSEWKGDVLYGSNEAVGGHYILGYAKSPELAEENHDHAPESVSLWHCNYHPDGGQLFYPLEKKPFVVPLALPGDDVQPKDFVNFWFDGSVGLYIHPNIWHDGVYTTYGRQRFFDRQGAVHARVSVDFPREFGCLLKGSLKEPS